MVNLKKNIQQGLASLGLDVSSHMLEQMVQYVELLAKWNQAYNLTAITTADAMLSRHILDSLTIAPYLRGTNILDVGAGAGLPGIPLAIVNPKRHFVLVDANKKRTQFMLQAKLGLGLSNISVVHTRVESYLPETKFDTVVTRAFASLHAIISATRHLYAKGGALLAMKGKYPQEELQEIKEHAIVEKLMVPGLAHERHLVCIEGIKNSG